MAIIEIKKACERHLAGMTPVVSTAFENVEFNPPDGLYQVARFSIQQPTDPVLGTGFYREQATLQVFVCGKTNKGTAEVLARAELIRDRFKKGTFLLENNIRIHVLTTPQISGVSVTQDRVICPVLISLTAEVYS
jgi:hypothetical protein